MKPHPALNEWLNATMSALEAHTLVMVQLTKPTEAAGDLKTIDVRPIMIKRVLHLSFTYHHKTRDIVKNYLPAEALAKIAELLAQQLTAARLYAVNEDLLLKKEEKDFTLSTQPARYTQAPTLTHDKPKQHVLKAQGQSYLHALGLTDAHGAVLKSAQDKFKQINKYIEILDGLLAQMGATKPLKIIDMGSGKGYLTFALYDHVVNTCKRPATVVGVEFRADMVKLCNGIAREAGFEGLSFVQGAIADYDCGNADVVIALHACDTATDDALYKAIKAKAQLIVVAPCCHKQIRRAMGTTAKAPLGFLLQHGTFTERMAEMVTDGLRAQLLELSGYSTKVFEFISDAHTPKNVMIVAQQSRKAPNVVALKSAIDAAKAQFGIERHYLETLLGV